MALELEIKVCQSKDCSSILFNEYTGAYSVTNLTGWDVSGVSNPDPSTAISATLTVTLPDETSVDIDMLAQGFPTEDTTVQLEITTALLGINSLEDGLYTFLYKVNIAGTIYQDYVEKLFYCNAECCVNKMYLELLEETDCACDDELIKKIRKVEVFLNGLIAAAKCGAKSRFKKILKILNKLCTNTDCGCS